jgi:hypothetical protein
VWYNRRTKQPTTLTHTMKRSQVLNVSRALCNILEEAQRLTNKLTLMQAELDISELETEELSDSLEDVLCELANVEVTMDEMEVYFVTNLQQRLIDVLVTEEETDDGVYRD